MCNRTPSITIHGVKLDKKDKASIKDEKSNVEQNQQKKCASINTGSDYVSMCIALKRAKKKHSINEV